MFEGVFRRPTPTGNIKNLTLNGFYVRFQIKALFLYFKYRFNQKTSKMKVPNCEQAIVKPEKLTKYLLNLAHPKGGSKAKFFKIHGYDLSNATELENEFMKILNENDVVDVLEIGYGINYSVVGILKSKTYSNNPLLKTIWCLSSDEETPHFVTAYPF